MNRVAIHLLMRCRARKAFFGGLGAIREPGAVPAALLARGFSNASGLEAGQITVTTG